MTVTKDFVMKIQVIPFSVQGRLKVMSFSAGRLRAGRGSSCHKFMLVMQKGRETHIVPEGGHWKGYVVVFPCGHWDDEPTRSVDVPPVNGPTSLHRQ